MSGKIIFCLMCVCLIWNIGLSQDYHFSLKSNNVAAYNPVSAALLGKDQQLSLAFRNELTQTNGYQNISVAYNQRVGKFAIGGMILKNHAGEKTLSNTRLQLSLSYEQSLNELNDALLLGLSGGLTQRKISLADHEFDSQYVEGFGYDSGLATGEFFESNNSMAPLLSVGLIYKKHFNRFEAKFGASLNYLDQAKLDFLNSPQKYDALHPSFFTNIELPWLEKFKGEVYLIYNQLSSMHELIAGVDFNFGLPGNKWWILGAGHRFGRNWMVQTGLKLKKCTFLVGYDLNYKSVSAINGQIEFGVLYSFKQEVIVNHRSFR